MWYLVLGLQVSGILNTGTGLLVSFASATSSMHALHTSGQQHDGDNHSWMQAAAHTHTHTHCPRWVQEWLLCGLEMWTQPTTRWPQQLLGSQARHSIIHSDPSSCVHWGSHSYPLLGEMSTGRETGPHYYGEMSTPGKKGPMITEMNYSQKKTRNINIRDKPHRMFQSNQTSWCLLLLSSWDWNHFQLLFNSPSCFSPSVLSYQCSVVFEKMYTRAGYACLHVALQLNCWRHNLHRHQQIAWFAVCKAPADLHSGLHTDSRTQAQNCDSQAKSDVSCLFQSQLEHLDCDRFIILLFRSMIASEAVTQVSDRGPDVTHVEEQHWFQHNLPKDKPALVLNHRWWQTNNSLGDTDKRTFN